YQLRNELEPALDKLIERKVEDFRLGLIEGKDMNATTHNTVNIIKSNISHAVVQITRSGKDVISRDTARKLKQIINSEEIKGLAEEDRFDVLDQADDVIKELSAPVTDKGKVYRGLKRLDRFISSVASKTLADFVAQLAVAYAKAHGVKEVVVPWAMPLDWLRYRQNNQIFVVIEPGASIIHARMRAALAEFHRRPNRRRITPATTK